MMRFALLVSMLLLATATHASSARAQGSQELAAPSPGTVVIQVPPGYQLRVEPAPPPFMAPPVAPLRLDPAGVALRGSPPRYDMGVLHDLRRRHSLARRAAILTPLAAAIGVLGGVGIATCQWEGDSPGLGCTAAILVMTSGVAATLVTGGLFVYRTNAESRAMRRAGIHISRTWGILGAIFYALPYTQIIGLILAARQMHLNRVALSRFEADGGGLRPKFY
ncbi:MAG: hypothetical protein GXP55_10585 [Deltaproteobacteria bacterium]|nr:hypothetical protein [Deltaproteobacteria bacterium]